MTSGPELYWPVQHVRQAGWIPRVVQVQVGGYSGGWVPWLGVHGRVYPGINAVWVLPGLNARPGPPGQPCHCLGTLGQA